MTDPKQPEALRLAQFCRAIARGLRVKPYIEDLNAAAALLAYQHAEIESLRAERDNYKALCEEAKPFASRCVELRAKLTVLELLSPWRTVRQLREENERLGKALADPLLTGIKMGNGTLDVGMEGPGPQLVAGMFLGMFEKYPDAKNYIEVTFGSRMGPILVTVMKPGGKTPDQLRREAERKLAEHLNTSNAMHTAQPAK